MADSRLYIPVPVLRDNANLPRRPGGSRRGFGSSIASSFTVNGWRMVALVSALRPDSCVVAAVRPSPNHGERKLAGKPDMIVLHYTGMSDTEEALAKLCSPGSEVSAHYVVLEDGYIIQCVPEAR